MNSFLSDILGDVGYDIGAVIKSVNSYGPTKEQATTLYNLTSKAINMAIEVAGNLPGSAAREKARSDLISASSAAFADPVNGMPALKKAAIQCYIEFNAVAEGNATLASARAGLYTDIVNNAKSLFKAVSSGLTIGMGSFGLAALGLGVLYFALLVKK